MNTKEISIDHFEPTLVFGPHNKNLKILQNHFPKLKIVSRGNQIILSGDELTIELFEEKFHELVHTIDQFGSISEVQLESILSGTNPKKSSTKTEEKPTETGDIILYGNNGKVIRAKTPNQRKMVSLLNKNDILFAIGPAGTGKTYTAVALAVKALKNKEVKRIILTRPAVEAGENLGFLPGDMKEKLDPYMQPLYDALNDMIPTDKLNQYLENRVVQIAPLAFMRGRTLDNAFVILDEAQNTTESQMKMFLTRMGANAKFIITGDTTQIDLPSKQPSGLLQAIHLLKKVEGISIIELDTTDVIRHKLVKAIIEQYGGK